MNNKPEVYLVGSTTLIAKQFTQYLEAIGASSAWIQKYTDKINSGISDADLLVEFEGRLCYRSWEPGLNPNVSRVREDTAAYLHNLIESGHGSVLEHVTLNFILHNVSRVLTHELVRHRAGTAFSQESLRFVRLDTSIRLRETPWLSTEERDRLLSKVYELMHEIECIYERRNVDKLPFEGKKRLTSDLRSFIPMGALTEIGFSANIRALRHMIETRTDPSAEDEIRDLFDKIAVICMHHVPYLFADFERQENGAWVPLLRSKV